MLKRFSKVFLLAVILYCKTGRYTSTVDNNYKVHSLAECDMYKIHNPREKLNNVFLAVCIG